MGRIMKTLGLYMRCLVDTLLLLEEMGVGERSIQDTAAYIKAFA
jgi:hypothetical protein